MQFKPSLILNGTLLGCLIVAIIGYLINASLPYPVALAQAEPTLPASSTEQAGDPALVDAVPVVEVIPPSEAQEPEPTAKPEKKKKNKPGGDCQVSEAFPDSIRQWCDLITSEANNHNLPPDLIAAVMLQESGGDHLAYSKSGAVGLMQVMPRDGLAASFMCANGPCFSSRPTIDELQDPEFNVEYGTRMLAGLTERLGSFRDALKAYGPKDVGYYYADLVMNIYQNYGN